VEADVYHTFHVDLLLICLLLKRKGKKVFFEMREDHPYSLYWKSNAPKCLLHPVVWLMAKWMGFVLRRVDAVTALSYDAVAYLKSWGIAPEKVHLWGNFPVVRKDHSLSLEDYMKRDNRVLYFGLIYSYSKQEVFLKALKGIPDIKYLVAGRFMTNELDTYRAKIINMPEWKEVEFIDGFKHEELDGFINRSTISNVVRDFSVYPMEKSGSFGIIKIFESMEAALPIICSDMPIYRDIMKEYKCGLLVNPLNEKEIHDAIQYLVTHKEEAWRMGQEGRRAVLEKYSWDALSVKFLKIVNEMIEKNK
jgi:glycosyltransferase involved in cell wall biosynthesis